MVVFVTLTLLGVPFPLLWALWAKASYQMAKECPENPQEWLRLAETCHGSWWPDYAGWLAERCGEEKAAPGELGGGGLEPICDAPGTYIYDH